MASTLALVRAQRAQLTGIKRETAGHIRAQFALARAQSRHAARTFADAYGRELATVGRVSSLWLHAPQHGNLLGLRKVVQAATARAAQFSAASITQAQTRAQTDATQHAPDLFRTLTDAAIVVPVIASLSGRTRLRASVSATASALPPISAQAVITRVSAIAATGGDSSAMYTGIIAAMGQAEWRAGVLGDTAVEYVYRATLGIFATANPDAVTGWQWYAHLGSSCIACTEMHGETVESPDAVYGHPFCDCYAVPFRGNPPEMLGGENWFYSQDADVQTAIVGPAAYEAIRTGAIVPRDLLSTADGYVRQASLKSLGVDASEYLA